MADYSEKQIEEAWQQASTVASVDSNVWRKDPCGAWIRRDLYGDTESEDGQKYGWTIDHIIPKSLFSDKEKGADSTPMNRWAMHWKNNESKADDFPRFKCVVTSEGNTNVSVEKFLRLHTSIILRLINANIGLKTYIGDNRVRPNWVKIYGETQIQQFLSEL